MRGIDIVAMHFSQNIKRRLTLAIFEKGYIPNKLYISNYTQDFCWGSYLNNCFIDRSQFIIPVQATLFRA